MSMYVEWSTPSEVSKAICAVDKVLASEFDLQIICKDTEYKMFVRAKELIKDDEQGYGFELTAVRLDEYYPEALT